MAVVEENFSATPSNWSTVRGGVALSRISSDDSGAILSTTNGTVRKTFDIGGINQFSECDVVASGDDADRSVFVMARMQNTGTAGFYAFTLNANKGTGALLLYVSSSSASPVTSFNIAVPAAPFRMRLEVEGTSLRGLINGSVVATGSNSTIAVGNYAGLGFFNCGTTATPPLRVDNWRAGLLTDVVDSGPPPGQFIPFFGR